MYATLIRRGLFLLTALVAANCVLALPARGAIGRENFFSDREQQFVNRAWDLNAREIAIGRNVERQAASADVKAFAERMIAYHTVFNDDLKALAARFRGSVPAGLDAESRGAVDRLSGLQGAEFDREYMRVTIDALRQAVGLYDRQAQDVAQTPTDAWAGSVLPKLQRQLQVAERIGRAVGVHDDPGSDGAAITAGHKEPASGR